MLKMCPLARHMPGILSDGGAYAFWGVGVGGICLILGAYMA